MTEALIVFGREPVPGQVKQRLAAEVGHGSALCIYRRMMHRTLRLASVAVKRRSGCRFVACSTGAPTTVDGFAESATRLGALVIPQAKGGLGRRMLSAFTAAESIGARRMTLIGCDCPGLSVSDLSFSLDALVDHDAVLGPTTDGGYWLIALREPKPALFRSMPWGGRAVFTQTTERLRESGLRYVCLPMRSDIDYLADWQAWLRGRARRSLPEGCIEALE